MKIFKVFGHYCLCVLLSRVLQDICKLFLPIFKPKFKKFFVFFHTGYYLHTTTTARIFKDLLFRVFREILRFTYSPEKASSLNEALLPVCLYCKIS